MQYKKSSNLKVVSSFCINIFLVEQSNGEKTTYRINTGQNAYVGKQKSTGSQSQEHVKLNSKTSSHIGNHAT